MSKRLFELQLADNPSPHGFDGFCHSLHLSTVSDGFYDSNLKSLRRHEVSIPHIMPIQASGSCIEPIRIATSSREPHRLLVQRNALTAPVCFIAASLLLIAAHEQEPTPTNPYKPIWHRWNHARALVEATKKLDMDHNRDCLVLLYLLATRRTHECPPPVFHKAMPRAQRLMCFRQQPQCQR